MKYTFALAIAFFLFIAGCFHEPKVGLTVKDCGSDRTCLENAARSCTLVKATIAASTGAITAYEEIKGYEGDNCLAYFRVVSSQYPIFADKDMTCKFPKAVIGTFDAITSFNSESAFTYCTGSLVDAIRSAP